jgi:hypothetical protein
VPTANLKLPTKKMEVHKHPHHVTHKKKTGEYLLEFFMLFLAVFLGFVAENLRETSVERHREKDYMQQMVEDLKADTAIYADYARRNAIIYDLTDTIVALVKNSDIKNHISKLTYSARILTAKWKEVAPVKRTYEEMKSSGYLRLISGKKIADSVSAYYSSLSELDTYNQVGLLWANNYAQAIAKVFDGAALFRIIKEKKEQKLSSDVLLTENRAALNELITSAGYFYGALSLNDHVASIRNSAARRLMAMINKEYHFDNE